MATLATSNRHLATPTKRGKAVRVTVATSSAIEGIRVPFKAGKAKVAKKPGKAKRQLSAVRQVRRTTDRKTASIGE